MANWWAPWTWFAGQSHSDNFIRNLGPGHPSRKLVVTESNAVEVSAVLCAVRVIAEGVAQLPLKIYREVDRAGMLVREVARDHPAYTALHRRPNSWMRSFEWRELMTMHAALTGNAYSIITRVNGKVDELIPVHPSAVTVIFENQRVSYRISAGNLTGDYEPREIFHLRGPTMDGVLGMPIVRLAAKAIGLSSELESSQYDRAQKNERPDGILKSAAGMGPEKKTEIAQHWKERFGPDGDGGTAVLDAGWDYQPMTMSAVDAQTIETRRFQIEEIARAFRVFPVMLMQSDKASTFASAEQFFLAHVIHTLTPWIERWEHALDGDLLIDDDVYSHFVVNGMLRGAAKDRAEFYAKGLGSGGSPAFFTQNEVRAWEDLDPKEGGDVLFAGSQNAAQQAENTESNDDGT